MQWYKHKSDEMFSTKTRILIKRFGLAGYGFYMAVMESIARELTTNDCMPDLKENAETLADYFNEQPGKIAEMMDFCIQENIFQESDIDKRILAVQMYDLLDDSVRKSQKIKTIIEHMKIQIDNHVKAKVLITEFYNDSGKSGKIRENPGNVVDHPENPQNAVDKIRKEEIRIDIDKEIDTDKKRKNTENPIIFQNGIEIIPNTLIVLIEYIQTLSILPEERSFLRNYKATGGLTAKLREQAYLIDIKQTLIDYSPDCIKTAANNYKLICDDRSKYNPTPVYSSILSFLATGVQKYYDMDIAIKRCGIINFKNDEKILTDFD